MRDDGGDEAAPAAKTEASQIGLTRGLVRLAEHQPAWRRLFAAEAAALRDALGDHAPRIEHVGSTAVDDLVAKPIIDIVVAIGDVRQGGEIVPMLERIGYEFIPWDPLIDRLFLVKGTPEARQIHLSLAEISSACWRSHVLFRDELRAHPETAADYAALKRDLAARYPEDRAAYTAGKAAFIESVIAAASRRGP